MRTSGTKSYEINTQKNTLLFYRKWVRATKARPRRKHEIVIVVYDVEFSSFGDCGSYCLLRYGGLWSGRNLPTLPPPSSVYEYKAAVAVPVRSPSSFQSFIAIESKHRIGFSVEDDFRFILSSITTRIKKLAEANKLNISTSCKLGT